MGLKSPDAPALELLSTILAGGRASRLHKRLVDERQIVYMGYVLASRIVFGLVVMILFWLFGRRAEPEYPI